MVALKETNNQVLKKLTQYLSHNLELPNETFRSCKKMNLTPFKESYSSEKSNIFQNPSDLSSYIEQKLDNNNFQKTLFSFIDKTNKKDSDIYNKAFIDRRLFSKIRND